MDWSTPFVIYRINAENKLEEVYHAQDIKQAKYWLTYIAQPGDVLCKTPVHPKHSQGTKRPEYWSHKAESGTPAAKEDEWQNIAKQKNFSEPFPEEQQKPVIA